jgi:hypothetical protein
MSLGAVRSVEVWWGSHGGVRSGMVVNGEDKADLLRRGRERSGCVRFYSVRYGRQGTVWIWRGVVRFGRAWSGRQGTET